MRFKRSLPMSWPHSSCQPQSLIILFMIIIASMIHFVFPLKPSSFCLDKPCNCFTVKDGPKNSEFDVTCRDIRSIDQFKKYMEYLIRIRNISGNNFQLTELTIEYSDPEVVLSIVNNELSDRDKNNLQSLSLTQNNLTYTSSLLLSSFEHLLVLDLSQNNINIFNFSSHPSLLQLNLNHNQLNSLNIDHVLDCFPSLENLNISFNNLSTLINSKSIENSSISTLDAKNNPWDCEEHLAWFMEYAIQAEKNVTTYKNDQFRCSTPQKLNGMSFEQAISVTESPTCKLCECLPTNLEYILVNCSDRGFDRFPENLPSRAKIVYLENNNIKNIQVPSSAVWQNIIHLHLKNNLISSLKGFEGGNFLKNLVSFRIQKNKLTEIPLHILVQFSKMESLAFGDNPWFCDCNTITFQSWLQQHFKQIQDVELIRCSNDNSDNLDSKRPIYKIPRSELCPQQSSSFEYLDLINGLLALGTLLVVLKLGWDYLWQKRTGKLPKFFKCNR